MHCQHIHGPGPTATPRGVQSQKTAHMSSPQSPVRQHGVNTRAPRQTPCASTPAHQCLFCLRACGVHARNLALASHVCSLPPYCSLNAILSCSVPAALLPSVNSCPGKYMWGGPGTCGQCSTVHGPTLNPTATQCPLPLPPLPILSPTCQPCRLHHWGMASPSS